MSVKRYTHLRLTGPELMELFPSATSVEQAAAMAYRSSLKTLAKAREVRRLNVRFNRITNPKVEKQVGDGLVASGERRKNRKFRTPAINNIFNQ